jgi:hypothetical protein
MHFQMTFSQLQQTYHAEYTADSNSATNIDNPNESHHQQPTSTALAQAGSKLTAAPPAIVPKRPGVGSFDFLSSPRLNRDTGMTFLTV